ncbi:MAG TPA: ABC transporter permease, partial [Cyclobacteriaceae bacterium]
NYFQKILVTTQFTLATMMTLGAIIAYQQFDHLTKMNWGLNSKNIITTYKSQLKAGEYEFMREQLLKVRGILAVTHSSGWNGMGAIKVNGEIKTFSIENVDEGYLPVLSIPILSGRNFSHDISSDFHNAVLVNETFVKAAGWDNPVGTEFTTVDSELTLRVVGVIGDYHRNSPIEKIEPLLMMMKPEQPYNQIFTKIVLGSEGVALKAIEQAFKKTFPLVPFQYDFMEDLYLQGLATEARWKRIMFIGACVTIFISCIGMFGLALLTGEKRFKEIGIRKVLGASVSAIVITLSKDFIKVVSVAVIIAIPVSYHFGNQWLESYSEKMELDVSLFLGAGSIILLFALLAISYQSIKAALMNPVDSLKSE